MTAASSLPPYRVRPAAPGDMAFIRDAWRRSFEPESILFRINRSAYQRRMDMLFDELLGELNAQARIASDMADDDNLLGFAVLREPELHYVYVKHDYRRIGVVPDLLHGARIERVTFRTKLGTDRIRPEERAWEWRPRFSL